MATQYRVILSPRGLAEIEEICGYYETIAPDYSRILYQTLVTRIGGLGDLPKVYRVYEYRRDPALTVHAMTVSPYIVYYRVSDSDLQVNVLSVLHGARRQPRRFR
jgi:plasmid stabilization system protein ParE